MKDTQTKRIFIIGATSAIANAAARLYAGQGSELHLLARNEQALQAQSKDLQVRGASHVSFEVLDANRFDRHKKAVENAVDALREIDIVLICHGTLPDQTETESDFNLIREAIDTNGLSVVSFATVVAEQLMQQGHGKLAVITSVAGDRGRRSNYVYGASKAMVSAFLQGLRGRLTPHNVHVTDIRPGLVDSPMTSHIEKGFLWASPERVASSIVRSIERNRHTVYTPFFWRYIMCVVRLIPNSIFKRLNF